MFPLSLIDKVTYNYLDKQFSESSDEKKIENLRYFKLPFIGKFSTFTKSKINKLAKKYCENVSVKIIFTSFKIGQTFSSKDLVPKGLKSNVIYKFCCAGCNACYIGETTTHISTRIQEHLRSDKQ